MGTIMHGLSLEKASARSCREGRGWVMGPGIWDALIMNGLPTLEKGIGLGG